MFYLLSEYFTCSFWRLNPLSLVPSVGSLRSLLDFSGKGLLQSIFLTFNDFNWMLVHLLQDIIKHFPRLLPALRPSIAPGLAYHPIELPCSLVHIGHGCWQNSFLWRFRVHLLALLSQFRFGLIEPSVAFSCPLVVLHDIVLWPLAHFHIWYSLVHSSDVFYSLVNLIESLVLPRGGYWSNHWSALLLWDNLQFGSCLCVQNRHVESIHVGILRFVVPG